jgi:hypothetical protein
MSDVFDVGARFGGFIQLGSGRELGDLAWRITLS